MGRRCGVLRYSLRDLVRNPRRTLASVIGVALAVGLFASTAFFVDGSAARMTERAIAPVAIDMQADLTSPLGSSLTVTQSIGGGPSLAAGQPATVTIVVTNTSDRPATALVVQDVIASQLSYVPASTSLNGGPSPDAGGESPLVGGLRWGSLTVGDKLTITYQVRSTGPIPAVAGLPMRATVVSAEDPMPAAANRLPAVSLSQFASRVATVSGVSAVDQLAAIDLPAASLSAGTKSLSQPLRLFAFDPVFLTHYPMVRQTAGAFSPGTVLLSPDAAQALGAGSGSNVSLTVPGRGSPLQLAVGGIADFSKADPLFAARSTDNQGEFIQVPNVIVVPLATFATILPSLKADAASGSPTLKSAPVLEADVRLDRSRLATDPALAAVVTQGIRRSMERLVPGRVTVIDNLSDALVAATGDSILAKVLFLFLGLPGVLVAAYLSRYAGGLLAEARRREQATLRARGAQPRHLVSDLTYTALGVAILGSALGLAIGLGTALLVLGPSALTSATRQSFLISAAVSVGAGVVTTLLAVYLPGRRALTREAGNERREMEVTTMPPVWLRMKVDLVFIAAAALVWIITNLAGGFRITPAEGQSVSLSFYTLLAPLLAWLGVTLLAVRLLLWGTGRLKLPAGKRVGRLTTWTLLRSVSRRSLALGSGIVALALAVAFGSSLALFIATYDSQKQADARFVVGSDLRVTPSALSQQSSDFAAQLRVPGVSGVTPVAQTSGAIVGTEKRTLVSIDSAVFGHVATLNDTFFPNVSPAAAMSALRSDPTGVLVSTEMARTFNIQTGDQINVQLADRTGHLVPVTFHAAGVFKDFPGYPQGIDLVGNLAFYQSATGVSQVSLFLVRTADPSPAAVGRVADLIKAGPGRSAPMLVETSATAFNRDQSTLTAVNLRGLGGLQAVYTALISAAGIGIFVFGLLLQRRKEYVTMRALGIRMGQLWGLVFGEAAAVALFSLGIGSVTGAVMAYMFVKILAPLFTIQPASLTVPADQLATLATLVIGGMLLSVAFAARSLRRLNPVELLREE
ncbi:MAG TPA: FtsX-like permease family protein [Candidatus Dormibacteraeota bacterium]|nr:FtsX-like permease family protein [Candidatus Dormibacteraeota bacterium]